MILSIEYGLRSGEAAVYGGAEGAMAHITAARSLRQKDGKAIVCAEWLFHSAFSVRIGIH